MIVESHNSANEILKRVRILSRVTVRGLLC